MANFNELPLALVRLILESHRQMLGHLLVDGVTDLLRDLKANLLLNLGTHVVCDLQNGRQSGKCYCEFGACLFFKDIFDNVFDVCDSLVLLLVLGTELPGVT
jgi:hypothetical protein